MRSSTDIGLDLGQPLKTLGEFRMGVHALFQGAGDVMLPDGSGLDLCRDLRAQRSSVPIILLTALKEDVDRIIGLELGGVLVAYSSFETKDKGDGYGSLWIAQPE